MMNNKDLLLMNDEYRNGEINFFMNVSHTKPYQKGRVLPAPAFLLAPRGAGG